MKRITFTYLFLILAYFPMLHASILSGSCGADGNNLTWSLNTEDSTLVIEGSGAMRDYAWNSYTYTVNSPWYAYRENIAYISLSSELTTIGNWAFFRCYYVKSIVIPVSITSIGVNAFESTQLNSVYISNLVAWCNISYESAAANPLCVAHHLYLHGNEVTDLIIPNEVTNINTGAFAYCESLISVSIPDNVLAIDMRAFFQCTNLTTVSIGNRVTTIGEQAFSDCSNLTNIIIGDSVANIGDNAFENCNNLINVTLNSNAICSVDHKMMAGVQKIFGTQVKEYIIGESVNRIGNNICYHCSNLEKITIGNNVVTIGTSAFSGCTNLTNVIMGNSVAEIGDLAFNCGGFTSIHLPESLTNVGKSVFSRSNLISIEIPENLTFVGQAMFYDCKRLKNVTFHDGITRIDGGAFNQCDSLNNTIIPDNVIEIGDYAFYRCSSLSNISLGNSLIRIGDGTFSNCGRLTSIVIPDHVKSIGNNAFSYCTNMTNVTIGNNVDTIGKQAFYLCRNLPDISIPASVKNIGTDAFVSCENLQTVFCMGDTPATFDENAPYPFGKSNRLIVYVPCGALETYLASDWNVYQLQYTPSEYDLQVFVKDLIGGTIKKESNSCESLITALPNEGYYFVQWSDGNTDNPREIILVQDTSFTAIFAIQKFAITFIDDNDTILASQEVEYNTMPVPPTDPVKKEDEQSTYTFAGWSPTIVPATEDAVYKATYTAKPKSEGIEDIFFEVKPQKVLENGNIHIFLPDGSKYSIIGNKIK